MPSCWCRKEKYDHMLARLITGIFLFLLLLITLPVAVVIALVYGGVPFLLLGIALLAWDRRWFARVGACLNAVWAPRD
jgi:hypothetical protein